MDKVTHVFWMEQLLKAKRAMPLVSADPGDRREFFGDAMTYYFDALAEIDALNKDLTAARAQRDYLEAGNKRLQDLLHSAVHALRSYQYGNGSPDLAEEVANSVEKALENKT